MKRTQEPMPTVPPVSGLLARRLVFTTLMLLAVSAKCADYQATVLSDGPRAYYRFNDDTGRAPINRNSGSLGPAGETPPQLTQRTPFFRPPGRGPETFLGFFFSPPAPK